MTHMHTVTETLPALPARAEPIQLSRKAMINNVTGLSDRAEDLEQITHKMSGAVEALGLAAMRITELTEDGNVLTGGDVHGLRFAVDPARDVANALVEGIELMTKEAIASERRKPEVVSVEAFGLKKGKHISELTDEEIIRWVQVSVSTVMEKELAKRLGETLKANGQLEEDLEKMEEASQAA